MASPGWDGSLDRRQAEATQESMRNAPVALLAAAVLTGCIPQYSDNGTEVIAAEAAKVRRLEIGMTVREVEELMGTEPIVFRQRFGSQSAESQEARPVRIDKFQTKDGKRVTIYFYRSGLKNQDDVCTDDETTAVVFVDGKVDALLPGEKSKEVIEVRFR